MPNNENSSIKVNKTDLNLTPYSPKAINDEIYLGEEFVINPIDLNIIITSNSKFNNNQNKKVNIKKYDLTKNSFSIINSTIKNSINKKQLKISRNYALILSSEYENINQISKYKYSKDKQFQSEIKNILKQNYFGGKDKKLRSSLGINQQYLNIKENKLSLPTCDIPPKSKRSFRKKENNMSNKINSLINHANISYNIIIENDKDKISKKNISNKNEKEKEYKRGDIRIHTSKTQVDKFTFKKTKSKMKSKASLLEEISNNINVLNHPNEFYAGLLNNILKDRDKDNKAKKISPFNAITPINKIELKRNSKTIIES